MQIILLEDIKGLGRKDEVVRVANGYGRNYLIPKGLGRLADEASIEQIQLKLKNIKKQAAREKIQTRKLSQKLPQVSLEFNLPSDEKGHLYAGLKEEEILARLKESAKNLPSDTKLVDYSRLKTVGEHEVRLVLGEGVETALKVKINAKTK